MELTVSTLDGASAGKITLSDAIFGLEPRADILHRMVRWQLAKRRAGTHAVKNRSAISRPKRPTSAWSKSSPPRCVSPAVAST